MWASFDVYPIVMEGSQSTRPLRRGELSPGDAMILEWEHLFKVILIGREGVGKTALLNRFQDDTYAEDLRPTIGADFFTRALRMPDRLDVGDKPGQVYERTAPVRVVKVQLWDTAGQEKFRSVVHSYYRGAHGVVMVFALNNKSTFESCKELYHRLKGTHLDEHYMGILVGNKADLVGDERKVTTKEAKALADTWGWLYIETSAKDDDGLVWDMFYDLSVSLFRQYGRFRGATLPNTHTLHEGSPLYVVGKPVDDHTTNIVPTKSKSCAC